MSKASALILYRILVIGIIIAVASQDHPLQAQSPTLVGEFIIEIDNGPASPMINVEALSTVYGSRSMHYPEMNRWDFYSSSLDYEALGFIDRPGGPQAPDTIGYAQYIVYCVSASYWVIIDWRDADLADQYQPSMDLHLFFNNATHTWSYSCNGNSGPLANHASKGVWELFFGQGGNHPRIPMTVQNYFNGGYAGTVAVDQVVQFSPYHAVCSIGNHTIAAPSPQPGSWWFDHWSDGGARSHTVTASLDNFAAVYTAYYNHQLSHMSTPGAALTAYPNPFNPVSTISYELQQRSHVHLTITDILGREVAVLVDEVKSPGAHQVQFNASNLGSGIYYCRLRDLNGLRMIRLLLLK